MYSTSGGLILISLLIGCSFAFSHPTMEHGVPLCALQEGAGSDTVHHFIPGFTVFI